MKIVVLVAAFGALAPLADAGQTAPRTQAPAAQGSTADRTAEAYSQFLRAHLLADEGDLNGAIAAYRRAMTLDPTAAAIPAGLAELYLNENRTSEAQALAEQALTIDPAHKQAHRVLGHVHAGAADSAQDSRTGRAARQDSITKAIAHFEAALETPVKQTEIDVRALLSRLYVAAEQFDKAIPLLSDIVKEAPSWRDGPSLLIDAYAGAGRMDEAVAWLQTSAPDNPQLYGTLANFYAREHRWADAAGAYDAALKASPRSFELRVNLASMLMNTGTRADVVRAREVLREAVAIRAGDERALVLLSQAERRGGDAAAAEAVARKVVAQNPRNPRGYYVLAEALEDQRRFQPVVDALAPAIASFRGGSDGTFALGMLLPHLGFAYQELGQFDKAIEVFEDARKLAPNDPAVISYLIRAQLAGRNYSTAAEIARAARAQHPDNLQFATLESLALRRAGKIDQSVSAMEGYFRGRSDDPDAHIAMAQVYNEANRGVQAVKTLRDAQAKFPQESAISFELGAVLDRQKRFAESEAVFRQLIAQQPNHAPALNYLGYMLAERGERLDESVDYLKRALAIDPENGSYLDSIGWAYFKDGKLDLALENLQRAAGMLTANSVVQDHYADLLFRLGRYDDAIAAWTRALAGDGDSIDRSEIDRKIRSARQKLPKK